MVVGAKEVQQTAADINSGLVNGALERLLLFTNKITEHHLCKYLASSGALEKVRGIFSLGDLAAENQILLA